MISLILQSFMIGEQKLELFVPQQQTVVPGEGVDTGDLYWAKVWPASIALSRFLHTNTDYIKDKTILELGAGLGLPSLTAAASARQIYCSDLSPEAMRIVTASAKHNNITNVQCAVYKWQQPAQLSNAEVVLLSDVAYDPKSFDPLYDLIMNFLNSHKTVIISTPHRLTARKFMERLMPWCIEQQAYIIEENGIDVYTTVFVLKKGSKRKL